MSDINVYSSVQHIYVNEAAASVSVVGAGPQGIPGPQGVPGIPGMVQMTQAAYNAIAPGVPGTIYVIIG